MKRRDFITLLGGAAMAWPIAARAQQVSVVGFLGSAPPETYSAFLTALRQGLSDAGSVELRNYRIEFRWAFDQFDRQVTPAPIGPVDGNHVHARGA